MPERMEAMTPDKIRKLAKDLVQLAKSWAHNGTDVGLDRVYKIFYQEADTDLVPKIEQALHSAYQKGLENGQQSRQD